MTDPVVAPHPPINVANAFDALILSRGGGVFIVGWVDDLIDPLRYVHVWGDGWRVTLEGSSLARVRRSDCEASLARTTHHPLGYFALTYEARSVSSNPPCRIEVGFQSGGAVTGVVQPALVEDEELRTTALAYLTSAQHFGAGQVKAIACLERGFGEQVLRLNAAVVARATASPYVRRFGSPRAELIASIVVCLYGRPEYLFLQAALYAGAPGLEGYEFVYVSNSPELAEGLISEARNAALVYDLSITLVILGGNAGFGGANNAALAGVLSNRLIFVNPDVFPKDANWAGKHSQILADNPLPETTLFGASLYYDDGSLMHGGMYIEMDEGVTFEGQTPVSWRLARVEHYGKGAPRDSVFTTPRAVPAVTGAFISVQRDWFETLDGFDTDYVFGHYEDADLCLRSRNGGVPAWLQDLRLWHLEGKGSTRRPEHEGGALVNRWLFSRRWGDLLDQGGLGRAAATLLESRPRTRD